MLQYCHLVQPLFLLYHYQGLAVVQPAKPALLQTVGLANNLQNRSKAHRLHRLVQRLENHPIHIE